MRDSTLHQARTLAALTDISRYISSSLDYKQTAYDCLTSLSENLDLERCALIMPPSRGRELEIRVGIDWTKKDAENMSLDIYESIPGKVFTTGMPMAVQNVGDLPGLYIPELDNREEGLHGYIAVPVKINRRTIGVLMAYRVSNDTMVDEDVSVMKIVASILSQTLKLADFVEDTNKKLVHENAELHAELEQHLNLKNLVSTSASMEAALSLVKRVAYTDALVLLRGESGTGKTLVAKGIHYSSRRSRGPMIVVNCASIPEPLIESELFGHEKGAFTGALNKRIGKFEAADGGTLVLDEIGEFSLETQAKVLRIIQEGAYERVGSNITRTADVRLICATNADLESRIREKKFREDLYYRLMVVPVFVPPLRERKEDILPLTHHFLQVFNKRYGKSIQPSEEAMHFLEEYSWPGNVRELEHAIERTVILAGDNENPVSDIPLLRPHSKVTPVGRIGGFRSPQLSPPNGERSPYERVPLRESQVRCVLEESAGIQTLAAKKLGVSLRQLRYAISKFGIDVREFKY